MKINLIILSFCFYVAASLATPTGINNIPTGDTVSHRVIAVQTFNSFGQGLNQFSANGAGNTSWWMGFKTGIEAAPLHIEVGMDSPVAVSNSGPLVFQTKANFSPWKNGLIALGLANIALTNFDRAGHPFSYGILSQDFGFIRTHAGYGLQLNSNTILFGVDRNFTFFDQKLNINTDLVQSGDHSYWLPAVGFKYEPFKYFVWESWANFPSKGRPSYIAKINLVFEV